MWRGGLAMPYSRALAPALAETEDLTSNMVGIGMNFAARATLQPNIEDTLLHASVEAVEKPDLRVLSVLTTRFGIYSRGGRGYLLLLCQHPRNNSFIKREGGTDRAH